MAPVKSIIIVLAFVSCCVCMPKLSRDPSAKTKAGEATNSELQIQEAEFDLIDASQQPKIEIPTEKSIQSESTKLKHDNTIKKLLRNQLLKRESFRDQFEETNEENPQLIPVQVSNPIKSQLGFEEVIFIPAVKRPHVESKPIERYEKLLESFIRGIISRVLQAKFKEVRIEEMEHKHGISS